MVDRAESISGPFSLEMSTGRRRPSATYWSWGRHVSWDKLYICVHVSAAKKGGLWGNYITLKYS